MRETYHSLSRIIHWLTALVILGLLSLGFYMSGLGFSENKLALYALHKSFGLLVLLLVFVRVAVYVFAGRPRSLPGHKIWEKALSHSAHAFLYFAMVALPLSGWVMSSAGDFTIQFFGIDVPDIVSKNKALFHSSREFHESVALILVIVIGLHMVGAFKHHFMDRDETLVRMTRPGLGFKGGVLVALLSGLLFLPPLYFTARDILHEVGEEDGDHQGNVIAAQGVRADIQQKPMVSAASDAAGLPSWAIISDKSDIAFQAMQYGQSFSGAFKNFSGAIFFDPKDLERSHAEIKIDVSSIKTGSDDRDMQALSESWFDVKNYPEARYEIDRFSKGDSAGDSAQYIAHGRLTIRGVSMPVDLPFSLQIDAQDGGARHAVMRGDLNLKRLDFGIGQGEWKDTHAIGNEVKISIKVEAVSR